MIFSNENQTALFIKEKDKAGKMVNKKISSYFEVVRIIDLLPESPNDRRVEIFTRNETFSNTFSVKLKDLSNNKEILSACNANYLIIESKYEGLVCSEIIRQKNSLLSQGKIEYEHHFMGWYEFKDTTRFFYDELDVPGIIKSTCVRPHGKFMRGDENNYDDMLNKHVYKTPMCLAYVIGFCGVVAARLQNSDIGVMVVGLTGTSSTGKTTALKLMGSIWGDVTSHANTIILRSRATDNAMLAQSSGLYGAPNILYDDLFVNSSIDKKQFLMHLADGTQKVACRRNGDVDFSQLGYLGCAVITGENPIMEGVDKDGGLLARIIDFNEYSWTQDAKDSRKIKKVIASNYGFKGKQFGKYVENLDIEDLEDMLDEYEAKFIDEINQNIDFKDRRARQYAVILLTAHLLNKCFGNKIDEKEIFEMLKNNEKNADIISNRGYASYKYIKSHFYNNQNGFDIIDELGNRTKAKGKRQGIAEFGSNILNLYISVNEIEGILKSGGYNQLRNLRKSWREAGFIQSEKDRYVVDYDTLGSCYHFVYHL